MKKTILILVVTMTMLSCSSKYYYAQVLQTTCANRSEKLATADPKIVYEDNNCVVFYETWQENGNGGFGIYNKTDQLLYVNLAKSFFICNGVSYPYYKARSWSEASTSTTGASSGYSTQITNSYATGSAYSSANASANSNAYYNPYSSTTISKAYGSSQAYGNSSVNIYRTTASSFVSTVSSKASSLSITEMPELAIAPKTTAWVNEYSIYSDLVVDCDLKRFPSDSALIQYEDEDSPIHFGNYITYYTENSDKEYIIQNNFYVSTVTNYAWPSLLTYKERTEKPCQNIANSTSKKYSNKYPYKIYDPYLNFDNTNCFYFIYSISSDKKLYKVGNTYYYDSNYKGYTQSDGGGSWIWEKK